MGSRYSPHQAHSTSLPKLQVFAPPSSTPNLLEVQEAFQFLLATTMHEAGRFELS